MFFSTNLDDYLVIELHELHELFVYEKWYIYFFI